MKNIIVSSEAVRNRTVTRQTCCRCEKQNTVIVSSEAVRNKTVLGVKYMCILRKQLSKKQNCDACIRYMCPVRQREGKPVMDVKDIQSRMVSESGRRETCDGCERYTIQNVE